MFTKQKVKLLLITTMIIIAAITGSVSARSRVFEQSTLNAVNARSANIPSENDAYVSAHPSAFDNYQCAIKDPAFEGDPGALLCDVDPMAGEGFFIENISVYTPEHVRMAEQTSEAELTFTHLPNLPDGVTISAVTLALNGDMYGYQTNVEIFDANQDNLVGGSATREFGAGRSAFNCYNYEQSGDNCVAERFEDVAMVVPLPVELVEGWYEAEDPTLTIVPASCQSVRTVQTESAYRQGCSFTGDDVTLYIAYEPTQIGFEAERIETVPSDEMDESFGRTEHQFTLSEPGNGEQWYGVVAVAVDELDNPDFTQQVPLNMRTDFDGGYQVFSNDVYGLNGFNYIAIDNTGFNGAVEETVVVKRPNHASDEDIYRVEKMSGRVLSDPTEFSAPQTVPTSDSYADIYTFEVEPETNLFVRINAPLDMEIGEIKLFPERPGSEPEYRFAGPTAADGFSADGPYNRDGRQNFVVETLIDTTQPETWAIVVPHGISGCIYATGAILCDTIEIDLIECEPGTFYSLRFDGCQPLLYPHPQSAGNNPIPATSVQTVGDVRIFSEGGFDMNPTFVEYGSNNYEFCTQDEWLGMPLIGSLADGIPPFLNSPPSEKLIPIRQGSVCVTNQDDIIAIGGVGDFGAMSGPSFRETSRRPVESLNGDIQLYFGDMLTVFGDHYEGELTIANGFVSPVSEEYRQINIWDWNNGGAEGEAGFEAWPNMPDGSRLEIDSADLVSVDSGIVEVSAAPNSYDFALEAEWAVSGIYASQVFVFSAETQSVPQHMEVASMVLRSHDEVDVEIARATITAPGQVRVTELRIADATIHQSEDMGGAHKPIRAIIDPVDNADCAGQSCINLTNAEDFSNPSWDMPDIDISQQAGSVIMQSDGKMQVYSDDHPDSEALRVAEGRNISQEFNFEAFDAEVTVSYMVCPAILGGVNPEPVLVIEGIAEIAIPSLGDGGDGGEKPGIRAEFLLCQTELRTVVLEFNASPAGIPIGATGLMLTGMNGRVDIAPQDYARITIGVKLATTDGQLLKDIEGNVVIDTRGLFGFDGGATVAGKVDLSGTITVAWNPMDILLRVEVSYLEWFEGYGQLHMWRGQGFGDPAPYSWLPDDNDTHFTGMVGATFKLEEGQVGKYFGIEIPRREIEIMAEVTFGEFCESDDCSELVWGVEGRIIIMEFTIGLFIGTKGEDLVGSGVQAEFFFANGGRTLIDQFGDSRASSNIPNGPTSLLGSGLLFETSGFTERCDETGTEVICTLAIGQDMGEALFSAAWSENTLPNVELISPAGENVIDMLGEPMLQDGEVYSVPLVGESLVRFTIDSKGVLFTIAEPQAGDWQLILSDVTGHENYNVLSAQNSRQPELRLTTDSGFNQLTAPMEITWVAEHADPTSRIHLSYMTEENYQTSVQGGEIVTPTNSIPLAVNLHPEDDRFVWEPVGLRNDSYRLMARIDHPIYGATYAFSDGVYNYVDTTPPAVPSRVTIRAVGGTDDNIIVSWDRNGEADLAQYQVIYSSPSLDHFGGFRTRTLGVAPSDPLLTNPDRELVRLAGQLEGVASVACVRAVDASGNVSDCSAEVQTIAGSTSAEFLTPPVVDSLSVGTGKTLAGTVIAASGDGVLLSWAHSCAGSYVGAPALEGNTNLDLGRNANFVLSNLPVGTYRVAARSYLHNDRLRQTIETITDFSDPLFIMLTDGIDSNGDGIPDDWAEAFGVVNATDDVDEDRLTALQEYLARTDPNNFDSDGDGFGDGDEALVAGTDACDPIDVPNAETALFLNVSPDNPVFNEDILPPGEEPPSREHISTFLNFDVTQTNDPNGLSEVKRLNIKALGVGSLNWTATASEPWVSLSSLAGGPLTDQSRHNTLGVQIVTSSLAPGYYEAMVEIQGTSDNRLYGAVVRVPVTVWVQRYSPKPDNAISGIVYLDDGTRRPDETVGEGIEVCLLTTQGLVATCTLTEEEGRYQFADVPARNFNLRAIGPNVVQTSDIELEVGEGAVSADIGIIFNTVPSAVETVGITADTQSWLGVIAMVTALLLLATLTKWQRRDG